jgi:hypothetical protein
VDISFLFRGLVIGLSIAAPVGPIGVLCIRRTLAEGRASGLVSGLGAATADAIYGCIAGFGLTFISSFLVSQQVWLRLVGGVFLCYLGLKTFFARPAEQAALAKGKGSRWCLCLNVFSDTHKPADYHFLCGDICWLGFGKHKWKLYVSGCFGLRCFHWLGPVVAHSERWYRRISGEVWPSRIAMGQQSFRCNHRRVWFVCSPECITMKTR